MRGKVGKIQQSSLSARVVFGSRRSNLSRLQVNPSKEESGGGPTSLPAILKVVGTLTVHTKETQTR